MKWNVRFAAFLVMAVFVGAGCSVLPGLKVLSGQDTGDAAQNRLVETTELVMANKAGTTDPALNGAADRIETASGSTIDIIEIHNDLNKHEFQVYALMLPDSSLSQLDSLNRFRRAIELTWRGTMQQSIGDETLKVTLDLVLSVANINHMLPCTGSRLDSLMKGQTEPDAVFHYLGAGKPGQFRHAVVIQMV